MHRKKKPLYRKVNTKARGVDHRFGGDFRHDRNSKKESREQTFGSMHGKNNRGLDYTPLFRFLVSKVGSNWNDVFSEAKSRLDREEPIYWLVALEENKKLDVVRIGESSYYTGLFVDDEGLLQFVNPNVKASDLTCYCSCCTHTINGILYEDWDKRETKQDSGKTIHQ